MDTGALPTLLTKRGTVGKISSGKVSLLSNAVMGISLEERELPVGKL